MLRAPSLDLAPRLVPERGGPFYPGDDVTFTLKINEGAFDAGTVQLNNYIPNYLLALMTGLDTANGVASLNLPIDELPTGSSVFARSPPGGAWFFREYHY